MCDTSASLESLKKSKCMEHHFVILSELGGAYTPLNKSVERQVNTLSNVGHSPLRTRLSSKRGFHGIRIKLTGI